MRKPRGNRQAVSIEIVYPANCKNCGKEVANEKQATLRTIISRGRDMYTRAPIVRRTLMPFCCMECADDYQLKADRD